MDGLLDLLVTITGLGVIFEVLGGGMLALAALTALGLIACAVALRAER